MTNFLIDAKTESGARLDKVEVNGTVVGAWKMDAFENILEMKLVGSGSHPGRMTLSGGLGIDYGLKVRRRDGSDFYCNRNTFLVKISVKKDGTLHLYERESENYHPEGNLGICYISFFEKHAVLKKDESGTFRVVDSYRNPETDIHEVKNLFRSLLRKKEKQQKLGRGDITFFENGVNALFENKEVQEWYAKESVKNK
jgi:hypothetical protein